MNGWQRLWAFFSGCCLLLALAIAVVTLPGTTDITQEEVFENLSTQSLEVLSFSKEHWLTVREDGIAIPIPSDIKLSDVEQFKSSYKTAASATVQQKRVRHLLYAGLWWLVPCSLIYVLGFGVAWVRRGFARKAI